MLKSAYEDMDTRQKYVKKEFFFGPELRASIEKAIGSTPSSLNLKEEFSHKAYLYWIDESYFFINDEV